MELETPAGKHYIATRADSEHIKVHEVYRGLHFRESQILPAFTWFLSGPGWSLVHYLLRMFEQKYMFQNNRLVNVKVNQSINQSTNIIILYYTLLHIYISESLIW